MVDKYDTLERKSDPSDVPKLNLLESICFSNKANKTTLSQKRKEKKDNFVHFLVTYSYCMPCDFLFLYLLFLGILFVRFFCQFLPRVSKLAALFSLTREFKEEKNPNSLNFWKYTFL